MDIELKWQNWTCLANTVTTLELQGNITGDLAEDMRRMLRNIQPPEPPDVIIANPDELEGYVTLDELDDEIVELPNPRGPEYVAGFKAGVEYGRDGDTEPDPDPPNEVVDALGAGASVMGVADICVLKDALVQLAHAYERLYGAVESAPRGYVMEELLGQERIVHAQAHITAAKVEEMTG